MNNVEFKMIDDEVFKQNTYILQHSQVLLRMYDVQHDTFTCVLTLRILY